MKEKIKVLIEKIKVTDVKTKIGAVAAAILTIIVISVAAVAMTSSDKKEDVTTTESELKTTKKEEIVTSENEKQNDETMIIVETVTDVNGEVVTNENGETTVETKAINIDKESPVKASTIAKIETSNTKKETSNTKKETLGVKTNETTNASNAVENVTVKPVESVTVKPTELVTVKPTEPVTELVTETTTKIYTYNGKNVSKIYYDAMVNQGNIDITEACVLKWVETEWGKGYELIWTNSKYGVSTVWYEEEYDYSNITHIVDEYGVKIFYNQFRYQIIYPDGTYTVLIRPDANQNDCLLYQ